MNFILKKLLTSDLFKTRIKKVINGASMAAGAWALTSTYVYLTTHISTLSQTDAMSIAATVSTAVGGLILTVGSAVYDQLDAGNVDAKIQIAAVTGSTETVNDKDSIQAVKDNKATPEALPSALATIQANKDPFYNSGGDQKGH